QISVPEHRTTFCIAEQTKNLKRGTLTKNQLTLGDPIWFVGLGVDDRVWVPTVFTKNRDRLYEREARPGICAPPRLRVASASLAFGRPLFRRRHAGSGLGIDEELCGEGRFGCPAIAWAQRRAPFSRRAAQQ